MLVRKVRLTQRAGCSSNGQTQKETIFFKNFYSYIMQYLGLKGEIKVIVK
jgi:hypothetical protein